MLPKVSFRIVTEWQVRGPIEEVARILTTPEDFPRWWGDVYLSVHKVAEGDAGGVGQKVEVHSKGWLPYRMNWQGRLVRNNKPESWEVEATGDLEGHGLWTLRQVGEVAHVTYDWQVSSDRFLFRLLAPALKGLMVSNHNWAMAKGQAGLLRELAALGYA